MNESSKHHIEEKFYDCLGFSGRNLPLCTLNFDVHFQEYITYKNNTTTSLSLLSFLQACITTWTYDLWLLVSYLLFLLLL